MTRTKKGRMIRARFSVSRAAAVRIQIWRGKKKLILQARVNVEPGLVAINLPSANGYPGDSYEL